MPVSSSALSVRNLVLEGAAISALQDLYDEMKASLINRDTEIKLCLVGMLARQHVLLLGPPGTAKSLVADMLGRALESDVFQRLLTRYTVPEEIFGPFSLVALENDIYTRQIAGYAPTAKVLVLDEIFKGSPALLNTLLTLLNERKFDNGNERINVPLEFAMGLSNELPKDTDSLGALYDRFPLRTWVDYIPNPDDMERLLTDPGLGEVSARLTLDQLDVLRRKVSQVYIPDSLVRTVIKIRSALNAEGIRASDRRYRNAMNLIRACAVLDGRDTATSSDLLILDKVLWESLESRQTVTAKVLEIAMPEAQQLHRLRDAGVEALSTLDLDNPNANPSTRDVMSAKKAIRSLLGDLEKIDNGGDVKDEVRANLNSMLTEIDRKIDAMMGKG